MDILRSKWKSHSQKLEILPFPWYSATILDNSELFRTQDKIPSWIPRSGDHWIMKKRIKYIIVKTPDTSLSNWLRKQHPSQSNISKSWSFLPIFNWLAKYSNVCILTCTWTMLRKYGVLFIACSEKIWECRKFQILALYTFKSAL